MSQGRLPLFIIHLKRYFLDEKVLFLGGWGGVQSAYFAPPKKYFSRL